MKLSSINEQSTGLLTNSGMIHSSDTVAPKVSMGGAH